MELSYSVTKRDYIKAIRPRPEYNGNVKLIRFALIFTLLGSLSGLAFWLLSMRVPMDTSSPTFVEIPMFYLVATVLLIWQLPRLKVPRIVDRKLRLGKLPPGFFGAHTAALGGTCCG